MRKIHKLALLCGFVISAASCSYKDIVEANYPDQKVYFPAARDGRFIVNSIAAPGKPYRYEVDLAAGRFIIPLSVYRGAVEKKGAIDVNIQIDNDTINDLITDGTLLNTELLPANRYSVASTVQIANDQDYTPFSISIDMDYLVASASKQKALCLRLSGSNVSTNPALDELIVILDPAILLPVAAFQAAPKDGSPKTISFSNQSAYATKYSWDFGDGGKSTEKSPEHTYAAGGVYEVTLTAEGITGETHSSTIKQTITVL